MSNPPHSSKEKTKPITRVVQAGDLKSPEVHKWQFVDLASDAKKQLDAVRADVLEKIKLEIQPKLAKQTAILKREAYEEAKQQGYEEGYQAGFETGQSIGIERADQQAFELLGPKVERLDSILSSLSRPYDLISADIYEQLASVAIKLAERITENAMEVDREKVLHFIEQAVQLLPNDSAEIEVEVNPEDLELVRFYQQGESKGWVVKANPKLQLGECSVRKLDSVVHHQWRVRMKKMLAQAESLVIAKSKLSDSCNENDEISQFEKSIHPKNSSS